MPGKVSSFKSSTLENLSNTVLGVGTYVYSLASFSVTTSTLLSEDLSSNLWCVGQSKGCSDWKEDILLQRSLTTTKPGFPQGDGVHAGDKSLIPAYFGCGGVVTVGATVFRCGLLGVDLVGTGLMFVTWA
ncbi:hypothetical protein ACLB2K_013701 [Fragaria x ananassa]